MAGRRQKRREERQTFGRGGSATRYQMRQKIFALGQDFYIEDQQGQKVFKVDGKVLRSGIHSTSGIRVATSCASCSKKSLALKTVWR